MAEIIGQQYRLGVDTTPAAAATYVNFQNEVTCSLDITAEKLEAASKDTGKWKKFIKTLLDATISVTANEDAAPTGTNYNYADVFALSSENHTDTYGGVRKFKLATTVSGGNSIILTGFIDSLGTAMENNGLVTYTFKIQQTAAPVLTPVA